MATLPEVLLTPADIPGAELKEPFQTHTVPALRWWLQCRGYFLPTSLKIISRIHQIIEEGKSNAVIDLDGSYLYKKFKQLKDAGEDVAPLGTPPPPPSGWVSITRENHTAVASTVPPITAGLVYTYLAGHVRRCSNSEGAFRALKRGYTHWASGRLEKIEVNTNHPGYCHVRSTTTPSMKPGMYKVYLLLKHDGPLTSVLQATCQCAAGISASCTHVSALLHALAGLTPSNFAPMVLQDTDDEEEILPVTSQLCKWNEPRKRKESTIPMSEAVFQKHDYLKPAKKTMKRLEDFDPRPPEYIGTATSRLPALLENLSGQQLCISLIFDPKCQHWNCDDGESVASSYHLPNVDALKSTISEFKESMHLSEDRIRQIEQNTRDQRLSPLWHSVLRNRITASNFGSVMSRRDDTPPDSLVLRLLQPKRFSTPATRYGIDMEPIAIAEYLKYQHTHGHTALTVSSSGFLVCSSHPFLGASPDGVVYDPSNNLEPFGYLEIKCPYKSKNISPKEASLSSGFFCFFDPTSDCLLLKENHAYYSQVQGEMGVGCRPWCDFVVYTNHRITVQRIRFDKAFWENKLLPKLVSFYDNCVAPEIVSPVHALGIPLRDLSK